jgi:hypothetical protein
MGADEVEVLVEEVDGVWVGVGVGIWESEGLEVLGVHGGGVVVVVRSRVVV